MDDINCPDDLGTELVNILYKNTNLSYNECSKNVIEIFEHMSVKLPQLEYLKNQLVKAINNTLDDAYNPDALNLIENLRNLSDLKYNLENGNNNFYEVQETIELYLQNLVKISVKTCPNIYKEALKKNREFILDVVDLWKLCTNKSYKLIIIRMFSDYFIADKILIDILFNNTNIVEESFYMLQESFKTDDYEAVEVLSIFLTYIFTNAQQLSLNFKELLKKEECIIKSLLIQIENEFYLKESKYFDDLENKTIQDLLICIFLSLNNHFFMPNENILLNYIHKEDTHHDSLFNRVIQLFNFQEEPLKKFKLELNNDTDMFLMNSVIKFLSDIFSNKLESASLLYLNEFQLLIDIIVRQLSNLSSDDQIRMDYLSLIDLILKNSDYFKMDYRLDDIKQCFNSIINEKIETLDQDIVRVLYVLFPKLKI